MDLELVSEAKQIVKEEDYDGGREIEGEKTHDHSDGSGGGATPLPWRRGRSSVVMAVEQAAVRKNPDSVWYWSLEMLFLLHLFYDMVQHGFLPDELLLSKILQA